MEQFDYGITREWLDEGHIAVITTQGNMTRAAIDVWANTAIDVVQKSGDGQVVYIMHDLSHPNQGFTPYSLKRAEDIYAIVPQGKRGYTAVVIRDGPINRLITLFLRRRSKNGGLMEERMFTSCDEALKWLRQMIKIEEG